MKALTIYQPYAFAIVAGLKQYETRPKRTNIRGRIAIHAGKRDLWKDGLLSMDDIHSLSQILSEYNTKKTNRAICVPPHLSMGAIIGTVEIVDCVRAEEVIASLTKQERQLGNYFPGYWAWVMKNPILFENPIPCRGKQGWWEWTEVNQK